MVNFTCNQCGRNYLYRKTLQRHVARNHTDHPVFICNQCERSFARSGNLEKHKRTCIDGQVAAVAAPAAKKRFICVAPEIKLRKARKLLGVAVAHLTVNMKDTRHLSALKEATAVFTSVMTKFHQEHRLCRFPQGS